MKHIEALPWLLSRIQDDLSRFGHVRSHIVIDGHDPVILDPPPPPPPGSDDDAFGAWMRAICDGRERALVALMMHFPDADAAHIMCMAPPGPRPNANVLSSIVILDGSFIDGGDLFATRRHLAIDVDYRDAKHPRLVANDPQPAPAYLN